MRGRGDPGHKIQRGRRFRPPMVPVILLAVLSSLVVILGCTEVAPTATPTPTSSPTPTPTPTPIPTPTPQAATPTGAGPESAVAGETAAHRAAKELLAVVPQEYDTAIFLDIRSLLDDPTLRSAFEEQGGLAILGPLAGPLHRQLELAVIATQGPGVVAILRGPLDMEELISSLKALGAGVESETHGPFEVWKVEVSTPFFTLGLATSLLDDRTAALAVSLSADNPSSEVLRAVLDTAQGVKDGLLADPTIEQLVDSTLPGFAMLVARDCSTFVGHQEGCTGFAMSTTVEGTDGIINGVLRFDSPATAEAALRAIREADAEESGEASGLLEGTEVSVEGNVVRLTSRTDIDEVLAGILDLGGS